MLNESDAAKRYNKIYRIKKEARSILEPWTGSCSIYLYLDVIEDSITKKEWIWRVADDKMTVMEYFEKLKSLFKYPELLSIQRPFRNSYIIKLTFPYEE